MEVGILFDKWWNEEIYYIYKINRYGAKLWLTKEQKLTNDITKRAMTKQWIRATQLVGLILKGDIS